MNNDCYISLLRQKSLRSYFYKNADADEVLFILGTGTLRTMMGNIKFSYGDYLVIPRGIIYRIDFDSEDNRLFVVESFSPIYRQTGTEISLAAPPEHSPFVRETLEHQKFRILR